MANADQNDSSAERATMMPRRPRVRLRVWFGLALLAGGGIFVVTNRLQDIPLGMVGIGEMSQQVYQPGPHFGLMGRRPWIERLRLVPTTRQIVRWPSDLNNSLTIKTKDHHALMPRLILIFSVVDPTRFRWRDGTTPSRSVEQRLLEALHVEFSAIGLIDLLSIERREQLRSSLVRSLRRLLKPNGIALDALWFVDSGVPPAVIDLLADLQRTKNPEGMATTLSVARRRLEQEAIDREAIAADLVAERRQQVLNRLRSAELERLKAIRSILVAPGGERLLQFQIIESLAQVDQIVLLDNQPTLDLFDIARLVPQSGERR